MTSRPERTVKQSVATIENLQRYRDAGHAVQTGIRYEQEHGSQDGTPKHLRTGVNMRAVDHTALVFLLIDKGIITFEEYAAAIADEAEREVGRYERRINEGIASTIKLV